MLDRFPGLAAWSRAAHLRFLHGDLDGAIGLMKRAAAAGAPASEPVAWVLLQLAELELHRGDAAAAGTIVRQVLAWYPTSSQALAQAARVDEAQGRPRDALERLREALREQPTPEHAFAAWRTARRAGDVAEAKRQAALLHGIGRLDEGGRYRRLFAEFYGEFPETRRLAEHLARAELAARPDLYSHAALAWVLFRAGKLAEAARHAQESLRLSTPDRELRDRAGTILRAAAVR
jgi:tetratricopeptide (TPR) repeat protein